MKKIVFSFITAVVLMTGFSMTALATTQTSSFNFYVGSDYSCFTTLKSKDDSSPAYIYVFSGPTLIYFRAYDAYYVSHNSGTGAGIVASGAARRMHTHVYEDGYSKCRLGSVANPYTGASTGVWSPDTLSSNTAPFCN